MMKQDLFFVYRFGVAATVAVMAAACGDSRSVSNFEDVGNVAQAATSPTRVIFDTDIGSDVDDAGALAVLNHLADRGEAKILAVVSTTDATTYYASGYIDAVNSWYGRPKTPIGVNKQQSKGLDRYTDAVALDGQYGHNVINKTDAEDMVQLYRDTLKSQPNNSVVIVTVGRLTGLYEYMLQHGDALLKQKVKRLVIMGGHKADYDDVRNNADGSNLEKGVAGEHARYVFERLQGEVEIYLSPEGQHIPSGGSLDNVDKNNPTRRAYVGYKKGLNGKGDGPKNLCPSHADDATQAVCTKHELSYWKSYDQIAVLFGVRGHLSGSEKIKHNRKISYEGDHRMIIRSSGGDVKELSIPSSRHIKVGNLIDGMMAAPPADHHVPPSDVPGLGDRIEAENYSAHRDTVVVDAPGYSGGARLGSTHLGDWVEYKIDVPAAGKHTITFVGATKIAGAAWEVSQGGNVLGHLDYPNSTGGYDPENMKSFSATLDVAKAGVQTWRFDVLAEHPDLDYFVVERKPASGEPGEVSVSLQVTHRYIEGVIEVDNESSVGIDAITLTLKGASGGFDWIKAPNSIDVWPQSGVSLSKNNDGVTSDIVQLGWSNGLAGGQRTSVDFDIDPNSLDGVSVEVDVEFSNGKVRGGVMTYRAGNSPDSDSFSWSGAP